MATKIWVGTDPGNVGDWGVAANWSPSGVPVNGDDVFLVDSSQAVTGSLNQSAVALTTLNIEQSYTGDIATVSTFLQIGTVTLRVGFHAGRNRPTGSGRVNIDLGTTTAAQAFIIDSKTVPTDTNRSTVRLKANNASTDIFVTGGLVAIADDAADTSTIGDINVDEAGNVIIGQGVTLTNANNDGGTLLLNSTPTTLTINGGNVTTQYAGAITTVTIRGGTFTSNSSGTITTLNVEGGTVFFDKSQEPRTVTTTNLENGSIRADETFITFTNAIALSGGGVKSITASKG